MNNHHASVPEETVLGVHRGIFMLGLVSFLTDLSSEMIFSVFSIFLTVILGASAALLGLIEGMADFAASSLDYVAGFVSDRTGKRKTLTILGYAFSTLAKTIIALQTTLFAAASFRVIERLGKSFQRVLRARSATVGKAGRPRWPPQDHRSRIHPVSLDVCGLHLRLCQVASRGSVSGLRRLLRH